MAEAGNGLEFLFYKPMNDFFKHELWSNFIKTNRL